MKFTYSSGQRPLEGYTLKRGIGRGGFGEVYFALSDGGKEVALKLLRDNTEVEMRGVAQCLNLKHPNLVNLYDLRTDARGDHWVVMEYVTGDSLHAVLGRHVSGLPLELAREWFLALARAIAYLHDHGIVHRDLKPANIFLENSNVKVGDYGLSKSISSSQRTAQTQSIGTVHYMAPEISTGNYNKQIDTYAAGIILYEMLTGHVPFDGESAGEILMKHLTSPADLSKVPVEFAAILGRALSKNPVQRYQSMTEMARAVEETAHPLGIARTPSPASVEQKAPAQPPPLTDSSTQHRALSSAWNASLAELCGSLALTAVFAAVATAMWSALAQTYSLTALGAVFLLTVATCWGILIPTKFWKEIEESWGRRVVMLVIGVLIGAHALWLNGWTPRAEGSEREFESLLPFAPLVPGEKDLAEAVAYLGYFAIIFFALRWWKMTDRKRSQRFSFAPLLATGFWALILLLVWPQPRNVSVVLVLASAIVQMVSPWEEPPPPSARRVRLRYA